MVALNPKRARILMGGLLAAGIIFTVLVLALDEDGRPGFPAGVRLPAETAEGASWSPDGRWIAIPNRAGILLRDADGESLRQLRAPRTPRYLGWIPGRIGWSRDGREVRYVTTVGPESASGSWATRVQTRGGEVRQVGLGHYASGVDWARRGWRVVFASGPNATGPRVEGRAKSALWEQTAPGAKPRKILDLPGAESNPEYSPDGKRLLFTYSPDGTFDQVWTSRSDGGDPKRLVGNTLSPVYRWSPDGSKVAIICDRFDGAGPQLLVVSFRGGPLHRLTDEKLTEAEPAWTPGGRWITYSTLGGEIKKVRPGGGKPVEIIDFDGEYINNMLWSPDGRQLAYSSVEMADGEYPAT